MSIKQVLVIPPMKSPTTGRLLGWTMTHDPDCYVPAARMRSHPWAQYPAHARVADSPGRRSLLDMWWRSLSASSARPGRALAGTVGVLTALAGGVAPRS